MTLGSFCMVLHGHVPYVLRHGRSPHGVDWLYEALAETYLPLLEVLGECEYLNARPRLALGLTPVLLEQLRHADVTEGFVAYLDDRRARAERERAELEAAGDVHLARLAQGWVDWHTARREQFERLDRDVVAAFVAHARSGTLEILTSAATHAYLPLLCEDASIRAQLRAGLEASERALGFRPRGIWLPECAYRPRGPWVPPVDWAHHDDRPGIERFLADEGITHCFLDDHVVERGRSELVRQGDAWHAVDWGEATKYPGRGWGSAHEVHGIFDEPGSPPGVFAFARDPAVCEQVWSGAVGYPAHGAYLDFHKLRGPGRGLRYWRVTGTDVEMGHKEPYEPEAVAGPIHEHAQHFVDLVEQRLQEHRAVTGRHGVVVAAFDAELFGHWWFEGPRFLRDVILTLGARSDVEASTPAELLERHPPDKAVALPAGSWGEGGDDRVWADPRVHWMWDVEYRCEARFGQLCRELPWREDERLAGLMRMAGRELLLLQASDWPFAVTRGQAVDYGIKRFVLHAQRFDSLVDLCTRVAGGRKSGEELDAADRHLVADVELHDVVLRHVDLEWWLS